MFRIALAVLVLGALSACQTVPYQPYARDVKKRPQTGGIIALNSTHRDEDVAKAYDMMKLNCAGNPYKVTEEGEVVVGQTTNSSANENTDYGNKRQVGTLFGLPVTSGSDRTNTTNTTASTTQLKEWQMTYECQVAQTTTAPAGIQQAKAIKKKIK